ncbi:MAG: hypothetical protein IKQ97_05410 [Eubacterium sp.]|nr:hypothetical protein [Eubacterium sp.]
MHIIAFILMFVFGSIGAASRGDYSGVVVIGKVLMGIGVFFFLACILTGFSTKGAGTVFLVSIVMAVLGGLLASKE